MTTEPNKKIVVIDDDPSVQEVVRAYLERDGYLVFVAGNAHDGIDLAARLKPGLIVLDLMLPDRPGEEIAREIRERSDVPILMLTAKASEDERVGGLAVEPHRCTLRHRIDVDHHRSLSERDARRGESGCHDREERPAQTGHGAGDQHARVLHAVHVDAERLGGDVDPEVYGGVPHPAVADIDEDRDRVELHLARRFVDTRRIISVSEAAARELGFPARQRKIAELLLPSRAHRYLQGGVCHTHRARYTNMGIMNGDG